VATAARDVPILTTTAASVSPSSLENTGEFTGRINFGLFAGFKELNAGVGPRPVNITIVCLASEGVCMWSDKSTSSERQDQITLEYAKARERTNSSAGVTDLAKEGFINFKLWLATVILLALAALFSVLAIGFSILNFIIVPVGTITGIRGLYLWNGLAAAFSLLVAILWGVLYHVQFQYNVMNPMDIANQWTSRDGASFGYSYWLLIGAMICFLANMVLVFVSTMEAREQRRTNAVINEKPADGIIMLY